MCVCICACVCGCAWGLLGPSPTLTRKKLTNTLRSWMTWRMCAVFLGERRVTNLICEKDCKKLYETLYDSNIMGEAERCVMDLMCASDCHGLYQS